MLYNKFKKIKIPGNWGLYKKQCNLVVRLKQCNLVARLKRQSAHTIFLERCGGGPKSKDFWPTVKPFLSNKCKNDQSTVLSVN